MPRNVDPWFQRLWWEIFPPPMIKIKLYCHAFDDDADKFAVNLLEMTVRGPFKSTLRRIVRQGGIYMSDKGKFVPLAQVLLVEEIDGPAL